MVVTFNNKASIAKNGIGIILHIINVLKITFSLKSIQGRNTSQTAIIASIAIKDQDSLSEVK